MKINFLITTLVGALILVTSCRDLSEKEIGTPFSKIEGLSATDWEITKVEIVDGADPAQSSKDFSDFYLNGDSKLRLSFSSDGTYQVFPGEGLNFFPSSDGLWKFNNDEAPNEIILNPDSDPQILSLESPTRIVDQELNVKYDKHFCVLEEGEPEVPVYSYRMSFQRVNQ